MKTIKTLALSAISLLLLSSCTNEFVCKSGNGNEITRELSLSSFDGLDMQIAADVVVRQGAVQSVKVIGDENVIEALDEDVRNGLWKIKFQDGCYKDYHLSVEVTVKDLSLVSISGAGDIEIEDFQDQSELDLMISGSGDIYVNQFDGIHYLNGIISGSGEIIVLDSMSVEDVEISISGSGKYKAYPLEANECEIRISGSGECYVNVRSALDIIVSGSGDIHYKGYPTIDQVVSGSVSISNEN